MPEWRWLRRRAVDCGQGGGTEEREKIPRWSAQWRWMMEDQARAGQGGNGWRASDGTCPGGTGPLRARFKAALRPARAGGVPRATRGVWPSCRLAHGPPCMEVANQRAQRGLDKPKPTSQRRSPLVQWAGARQLS